MHVANLVRLWTFSTVIGTRGAKKNPKEQKLTHVSDEGVLARDARNTNSDFSS